MIVTGMSGAGKTSVLKFLEDINFFCVDNIPPALLPKFAELCYEQEGEIERVAMGIDIRGGKLFNDLFEVLSDLQHKGYEYEILFLDASDDVLIKRYKETRRSHPLSKNGSIQEGIQKEREILKDVKRKATYIIDTSQILTRQLKEQINRIFVENQSYENLMITVLSFGFKYGIPADSDLVFDVRFLPNPFYIQELKEMTGNDEPVSSYVMSFEESRTFLKKLVDIFASYKMNVLHFHFADDEAWRLEIPKIVLSSASAAQAASTALLPLRMPFTMPLERMDTPSFSSIMTLKRIADTRNKQKTERRGKFVIFV